MVDPTCELFNKWEKKGVLVSAVQCNIGEEILKIEQIPNENKW